MQSFNAEDCIFNYKNCFMNNYSLTGGPITYDRNNSNVLSGKTKMNIKNKNLRQFYLSFNEISN